MSEICFFCGKVHPHPTRGGKVGREPEACREHRRAVKRFEVRSAARKLGHQNRRRRLGMEA